MAFPANPVNNQTYNDGTYTYRYNSTFRTWTKIAQTTANISNVTANTTTSNTITASNTVSVGNTVISNANVTVGNTVVANNEITVGNTTVSNSNVTVGNTSITGNAVTVGNTTISNTNVVVGNTTISSSNVTVGNTSITTDNVVVGNTSISSNTISVGNTTISSSNVSVGNTVISNNSISTEAFTGNLTNGNTSIVPAANGNITLSVAGNANVLTVTSGGIIVTGYGNFTGNVLAQTVTSNSNLVANGGYLYLDNGVIAVANGVAGIFNAGISNINLGLAANNITMGGSNGNVTARGTFNANTIQNNGNLVVTDTATVTNLRISDLYSNRTPVSVFTNTVVDSFPTARYRSAKYTMRVNSDDGYQAVEVLLVHDSINSYVTIYGSLSTTGSDFVTLSTNIESGNVRLLATSTGSANTTVNLLGTYVAD